MVVDNTQFADYYKCVVLQKYIVLQYAINTMSLHMGHDLN